MKIPVVSGCSGGGGEERRREEAKGRSRWISGGGAGGNGWRAKRVGVSVLPNRSINCGRGAQNAQRLERCREQPYRGLGTPSALSGPALFIDRRDGGLAPLVADIWPRTMSPNTLTAR